MLAFLKRRKNEQICPFGIRCWVSELVIDDEIFNYEMEKHKLQMQIQNVQMKQSKALEQQIQMYMFDWTITMNDRPLPEERKSPIIKVIFKRCHDHPYYTKILEGNNQTESKSF